MGNNKNRKRTLEELNVIDDFLMNAAAADPVVGEAFCRTLLSALLQREFGRLRVVTQRGIAAPDPSLRGIRMDVEILEEAEENEASVDMEKPVLAVYDLEPNLRREVHLPKHNRFYQAKIDTRYLNRGEKDFRKLPRLYVITITDFDPFGWDYMQYTIRNACVEVPELNYDDELQFLYFYTGGHKGGSSRIRAMLKYIQQSIPENVTDTATKKLHDYVEQIRLSPEVRQSYMTLEDKIYFERKDAKEEGKIEQLIEMVCKKLRKNREVTQIAEELEADEAVIAAICAAAAVCAPDYDCEAVLEQWWERKENECTAAQSAEIVRKY